MGEAIYTQLPFTGERGGTMTTYTTYRTTSTGGRGNHDHGGEGVPEPGTHISLVANEGGSSYHDTKHFVQRSFDLTLRTWKWIGWVGGSTTKPGMSTRGTSPHHSSPKIRQVTRSDRGFPSPSVCLSLLQWIQQYGVQMGSKCIKMHSSIPQMALEREIPKMRGCCGAIGAPILGPKTWMLSSLLVVRSTSACH